jgi:putative copper resistance protein D
MRIAITVAAGLLALAAVMGALAAAWATVASVALVAGAVIVWVPAQQWSRIHVRAARWLRMTGITFLALALALLLGIHEHVRLSPEAAREGNPVPPTEASVARGRELYGPSCAQCHGATGRGDGSLTEALAMPPADFELHIPFHTDLFFFQIITRGLGEVMPGFADRMTEEDRWNLINFLRTEHSLEEQQ